MKRNEATWQLSQCSPDPPTVWWFDHLLSAAAAVCLSKVLSFFLLVLFVGGRGGVAVQGGVAAMTLPIASHLVAHLRLLSALMSQPFLPSLSPVEMEHTFQPLSAAIRAEAELNESPYGN